MPLALVFFGFNVAGRAAALIAIAVLIVALAYVVWLRGHVPSPGSPTGDSSSDDPLPSRRTARAVDPLAMASGIPRLWRHAVRWIPFAAMAVGSAYFIGQDFRDHAGYVGIDAHVYFRGAAAWVANDNPWDAAYRYLHFASLPWTLPLIAPFTLLSERTFAALLIALDAGAAVYLVRTAGLSFIWLIFPPLVQGTLNGNPAIIALALIVAGLGPLGVLLRPQLAYGLVGERRWRAIFVTALLGVALLPFVPWGTYVADFATISARYAQEGGGGMSAGSIPALVLGLVSVLALATVSRREAGWLATIVLVPGNGWYAGAAAITFLNPILALGLSAPLIGLPTATVAVYAAARLALRWMPSLDPRWPLEALVEPYRQWRQEAPGPDN
jgi:hypothetical protein